MNASPRRLDLEGDLALEVAGVPVTFHASGARAVVRIARVSDAHRVLRALPGRRLRRSALHRLDAALRHGDVAFAIRVGNHEVGNAGPGSRAGWLSRLLALGPVAVHLRPLFRAWRTRHGEVRPADA